MKIPENLWLQDIKKTEYIVPDIIIKKEEDWEIQLNDGWMGNYQINDYQYISQTAILQGYEMMGNAIDAEIF